MRNAMLRPPIHDTCLAPQKPVPRHTSVFLRNPLIFIWIIAVIATLIAADGGGIYFVIGAFLSLTLTVLIARKWGQSAARAIKCAILRAS